MKGRFQTFDLIVGEVEVIGSFTPLLIVQLPLLRFELIEFALERLLELLRLLARSH